MAERPAKGKPRRRCAIYTRKSSEEGLEQEFNSLDAQREACAAFVASQRHEGWMLLRERYDDGGFSGGTMERPALQRLLADIAAGRIDIVVVSREGGRTAAGAASCGGSASTTAPLFRDFCRFVNATRATSLLSASSNPAPSATIFAIL